VRGVGDKFKRRWCWSVGFLCLVVFGSVLSADEVDKLIEEAGAPARFITHTVNFSAREEKFTFDSNEGKITLKLWAIKDRDNYVAIWHEQESKLYVVAANPASASKEIKMPATYNAGGDGFDGELGVRITTFPYCYGSNQSADKRRFRFSSGWESLTLTDTSTWLKEHNAEAVYELTFRCDPVLGYVVDMDVQFKTNEKSDENEHPFGPELVNIYPSHINMSETDDAGWRYEYTVYTPADTDKYIGWVNDFPQSGSVNTLRVRNGGFSAFLFDPVEQGPALICMANEDSSPRSTKCNLSYEQRHFVSLSKQRDVNGYFNVGAKYRLVFLPRDMTRYIMEKVEITDRGSDGAFAIRIGEAEDFETNRLLKPTGNTKNYPELQVSEEDAHSGDRSFAIDGDSRILIDPKPAAEPNETYTLEAWVKVVKGETVETEAYLLAEPPQWGPKGVKPEPYQSESAKDNDGWKKITLQFKNGPIGATYRLYAVVKGGCEKVYLDDVLITRVISPENITSNETK
jgi:hypothetical protein